MGESLKHHFSSLTQEKYGRGNVTTTGREFLRTKGELYIWSGKAYMHHPETPRPQSIPAETQDCSTVYTS